MIDFHCHIDLYPNPSQVLDQCERLGMYVLAVTTTPLAWEGNKLFLANRKRLKPAVGLHPELVYERQHELDILLELISESPYVGEVGIDGTKEQKPHIALQKSVFSAVLEHCSNSGGRIISIHSRKAASLVMECISQVPDAGVPVLHWFSGSQEELKRAIELGCWFSVGPAMFSGRRGRELVEAMPKDRIITESDGPFAIYRQKQLEPWDVQIAERNLAIVWNETLQEAKAKIKDNFKSLMTKI